MKSALFILLFLCSLRMFGQNEIDSAIFERVSKELIRRKIQEVTGVISDRNCYYDTIYQETDTITFYASCYEVDYNLNWVGDFNQDGEKDMMICFTDVGVGGGGNDYMSDYLMVLLKNQQIDSILSIGGDGKMANGNLQIDSVKNKRIYASYL